jgi:hypothetical protein
MPGPSRKAVRFSGITVSGWETSRNVHHTGGEGRFTQKKKGARSPRTPFMERVNFGLLLLDALNVLVEVGDALLHFAFMALRKAEKQGPPNRHILAAMRRQFGFATNDAGHMQGWILSAGFLRERRKIGGRYLQC